MADEETLQTEQAEPAKAEDAKAEPETKVAYKDVPAPPKPLEKMTAKELREYALTIGTIVGVHSMNKEELLGALKENLGMDEEGGKKLFSKEISKAKAEIKELKAQREQARESGDKKKVEIFRKRISRLKKKTRSLAAAG